MQKGERMDDLISKVSVCEILADIYPTDGEKVVAVKDIDKAYEAILNLQSAQPEIMRCKDCKHKPSGSGVNHDISFPDEVCPCQCEDYWYSWMPEDNWFCGDWERREE